jgi:hypothetical protein
MIAYAAIGTIAGLTAGLGNALVSVSLASGQVGGFTHQDGGALDGFDTRRTNRSCDRRRIIGVGFLAGAARAIEIAMADSGSSAKARPLQRIR